MPSMIVPIAIIVTERGRRLNDSLSVLYQVIYVVSIYIEINYSLLLKIFLYFYIEDLSYLIITSSCPTWSGKLVLQYG